MGNTFQAMIPQQGTLDRSPRPWGLALSVFVILVFVMHSVGRAEPGIPASGGGDGPVVRITLSEALDMFLKQNFAVMVGKFGIETAKARELTARLFPNPELSVGLFSSVTQGCNTARCGGVMPQISQLFLIAGKRGYAIESAALGTAGAGAEFEDAVRQLSATVKETYFRVQVIQEHLDVDRKIKDRLDNLIYETSIDPQLKIAERKQIRLELLAVKAEREVIKDLRDLGEAGLDLRILLGLNPEVHLVLVSPLVYKQIEPDFQALRDALITARPDLRAKRLLSERKKAEFKLAKAFQYPDVSVGAGIMLQGPQGPDNQQQYNVGLSVPLPIFDRNQGGILQAETAIQVADAEYRRALNQAFNELDRSYHRFLENRRLVQVYQKGVLERALTLLEIAQHDREKGQLGILELVDAVRAAHETKEDYLDTLFSYHRAVIRLENAAGQVMH
ncbi:MAG: TolC family protein [Nitrospirales bacterium]